MPEEVFDAALAAGAIKWTLYMYTWSDQEAFPVAAIQADTQDLDESSTYGVQSWLRITPEQAVISSNVAAIPTRGSRINASYPSHGGQGIVAADRMVMVLDPNEQAVAAVESSNLQGSYIDFSPEQGRRVQDAHVWKLYIPACVKLWQNPQSVDISHRADARCGRHEHGVLHGAGAGRVAVRSGQHHGLRGDNCDTWDHVPVRVRGDEQLAVPPARPAKGKAGRKVR